MSGLGQRTKSMISLSPDIMQQLAKESSRTHPCSSKSLTTWNCLSMIIWRRVRLVVIIGDLAASLQSPVEYVHMAIMQCTMNNAIGKFDSLLLICPDYNIKVAKRPSILQDFQWDWVTYFHLHKPFNHIKVATRYSSFQHRKFIKEKMSIAPQPLWGRHVAMLGSLDGWIIIIIWPSWHVTFGVFAQRDLLEKSGNPGLDSTTHYVRVIDRQTQCQEWLEEEKVAHLHCIGQSTFVTRPDAA